MYSTPWALLSDPGSTQSLSSTQNIQVPHTSLGSAYIGPGFHTRALSPTHRPWILPSCASLCCDKTLTML